MKLLPESSRSFQVSSFPGCIRAGKKIIKNDSSKNDFLINYLKYSTEPPRLGSLACKSLWLLLYWLQTTTYGSKVAHTSSGKTTVKNSSRNKHLDVLSRTIPGTHQTGGEISRIWAGLLNANDAGLAGIATGLVGSGSCYYDL